MSTRWLSLEIVIERALKQFPSLRSYFLSTDEPQARFQRLNKAFNDPITEVHLLFLQSTLPAFTHANKFLQREEPLIHLLRPHLLSLFRKLASKFIKPRIIISCQPLISVDFKSRENQLDDDDLVIGFMTRQLLRRLLDSGDISSSQASNFHLSVREFFVHTTAYLLKWAPFSDELIKHATWIDYNQRLDSSFTSVEFFVGKYPLILKDIDLDKLHEQFLDYQIFDEVDLPERIKDACNIDQEEQDNKLCRVDILWSFFNECKVPGTNERMFDVLFRVAEVVLTIPHSNAGEERLFSYINKNKTPSRNSLSLEGTLSSIVTIKTHIDNPLQWKPSETLTKNAKKATASYNMQHK